MSDVPRKGKKTHADFTVRLGEDELGRIFHLRDSLEQSESLIQNAKGGVGKSIVPIGLGVCLAEMGKKVILIDGDLGGANLHTLLGVRFPEVSLEDFLLRRVSRLEDTVIPTSIENISLISGADDILGAANPTYSQKLRLVEQIEELAADFVLSTLAPAPLLTPWTCSTTLPGKLPCSPVWSRRCKTSMGSSKAPCSGSFPGNSPATRTPRPLFTKWGAKRGGSNFQSIQDLANHLEVTAPERFAKLERVLHSFNVNLVVNMVKTDQDLKSVEIIKSGCGDFLSLQPQNTYSLHQPYE